MLSDALIVTRRSQGFWEGTVSKVYMVGMVPSGGYVTALLLKCITAEMAVQGGKNSHPDVITANIHFMKPTKAGAFTARVDVLKNGRTTATVRATLLQDGVECLQCMATCGDLKAAVAKGPNMRCPTLSVGVDAPCLPRLDECVRLPNHGKASEKRNSVRERVEIFTSVREASMFDFERDPTG